MSRDFEIRKQQCISGERGESLMSLLVSLALVGVVFAAAFQGFMNAFQYSVDLKTKARAEENAKTILDLMAFDIRMAGAGMPLGQTAFAIGGAGLGAAPLPVLLSSSASNINIRLNESGASTILTASYTPSTSALSFSVASAADFENGDTIYISNMTVGGTAGLRGTITNAAGNTLTIAADYTATPSATFGSGSVVSRVTNVVFDSPSDWSGITRDAELGAVRLAPKSTFLATYRDSSGGALVLPLTDSMIANDLSSIVLEISVQGEKPLSDGTIYTATARETIALRNLNMNR